MRLSTEAELKVTHVIVSLSDGGAQAVLFNLVSKSPQHQHSVISMSNTGKYGEPLAKLGVPVQALGMKRGALSLSGAFKLFSILRKDKPDVVQTWMYHSDLIGGLAARLAGIKNVVWGIHHSTLDDAGTAKSTKIMVKILSPLSRFLPKKIISCSQEALKVHVDVGYDKDKLVFAANGYDLSRFERKPGHFEGLKGGFSRPEGHVVFATVARWNPQKDQKNLIDACARLKRAGSFKFSCLLVGPAVDADNTVLASHIKEKEVEDCVHLMGSCTDVPALMNAIDFHVLPSSFGEAFPNVVAEAMSCSTPCIVTDVGDAASMVSTHGWVVPPRDSAALAIAIEQAAEKLGRLDEWEQLKDECRQHAVGVFDVHRMVAEYEAVWNEPG